MNVVCQSNTLKTLLNYVQTTMRKLLNLTLDCHIAHAIIELTEKSVCEFSSQGRQILMPESVSEGEDRELFLWWNQEEIR